MSPDAGENLRKLQTAPAEDSGGCRIGAERIRRNGSCSAVAREAGFAVISGPEHERPQGFQV